jgi:hypothetical protein
LIDCCRLMSLWMADKATIGDMRRTIRAIRLRQATSRSHLLPTLLPPPILLNTHSHTHSLSLTHIIENIAKRATTRPTTTQRRRAICLAAIAAGSTRRRARCRRSCARRSTLPPTCCAPASIRCVGRLASRSMLAWTTSAHSAARFTTTTTTTTTNTTILPCELVLCLIKSRHYSVCFLLFPNHYYYVDRSRLRRQLRKIKFKNERQQR